MAISPTLILAQTPHDIALNQFATELSAKTIPFLKQAARYVKGRLDSDWETVTSQKRLSQMQRDISEQLNEIYSRMDDLLFDEFKELSALEGAFVVNSTQAVLNPSFIMLAVEDQKLWSAVTTSSLLLEPKKGPLDFTKYVESVGVNSIKEINNLIGYGYSQGLTLQEMVSGIIGTRKQGYKDGLIDGDRVSANKAVRTSINHIATQSRLKVYSQNKNIVEGYRIIATLDSGTSAQCKGLDQTVVMNGDRYRPYPPFHYNCRTTTIPEIKGKALKDSEVTRAANFKAQGDVKKGTVGQVSATEQYYDLLKKQSAAQQDLALGKARGKIFRNSGLSVDEFRKVMTDKMGQPRNLKELAAQDSRILEYMESNKLKQYLD